MKGYCCITKCLLSTCCIRVYMRVKLLCVRCVSQPEMKLSICALYVSIFVLCWKGWLISGVQTHVLHKLCIKYENWILFQACIYIVV